MRRILTVSLKCLVLYGGLLALFTATPLGRVTGNAVAYTAATVLHLCVGQPVEWAETNNTIYLGLSGRDGIVTEEATISTLQHIRNVPLFLAVVLAMASAWSRRLLAVLVVGSCGLILLDGMVVGLDAWQVLHGDAPFNAAYQVLAIIGVFHATGGMLAAPVFVGALAALTAVGDPDGQRRRVGRNEACSCGSGRKFKRCCGVDRNRYRRLGTGRVT